MSVCQSASRDSACPIARAIDASVSGPTKPESISADEHAERLDVGVGERRVVVRGVGEAEGPPEPQGALGRHARHLGDLQPRVAARSVEQQPLERLAGVRDRALPGLSHACRRPQPVVCTTSTSNSRPAGRVGRHRTQQPALDAGQAAVADDEQVRVLPPDHVEQRLHRRALHGHGLHVLRAGALARSCAVRTVSSAGWDPTTW